jgi:alpha-mannosidase
VIDGPLVTEWEIRYRMEVPLGIDAGRTARVDDTGPLELCTRVRMRRDSSTLEFTTELDNAIEDHRLRVCFPTGFASTAYYTTTPFALERREVAREHRSAKIEFETGVVPNQGVVALVDGRDAFGVFNRGLYECEVTEHPDRIVAITLLRSFGNEVRRDGAEMGYMRRKLTFEYALAFFEETPVDHVAAEGDRWRVGMRSVCGKRVEPSPGRADASYLRLSNRSVLLSACEMRGEHVIVRLYNISREPQRCVMETGFGFGDVELVSFDERPAELAGTSIRGVSGRSDGGEVELEIGPATIATLKVTPARNE